MAHAIHGIPFTATSGELAGTYGVDPTVVWGITVVNTNAAAGSVIIRNGGPAGMPIAAVAVGGLASSVNGVADRDWHPGRMANNGVYVEVEGGSASITGTLWVS